MGSTMCFAKQDPQAAACSRRSLELKNYPFILKISSCTTFFNILIFRPPLVTMLYYPYSDDQYLILLIVLRIIFFTRYHQPILVLPLTG